MQFIDTHCHIQSAGVQNGERATRELWAKGTGLTAAEVIENAQKVGVTKMVCVGCDLEDSRLAVEVVQNRPECWASIGIHPHEARHYVGNQARLGAFAGLVEEPKVVAIGECGLDYFYEHSPKEAQVEVLKFQIELAIEHNLPMIFHVREAFDDFWPIFEAYGSHIKGVLHSFTDSEANLQKAVQHELCIGVNGIATFAKKSEQIAMYKAIPLENLLLETDAPFLTPTPYRGTINEPKHIRTVAEFLAGLRGERVEALADATTHNALRLFGLNG